MLRNDSAHHKPVVLTMISVVGPEPTLFTAATEIVYCVDGDRLEIVARLLATSATAVTSIPPELLAVTT